MTGTDQNGGCGTDEEEVVDFFTQARKSLRLMSPFDDLVKSLSALTLPKEMASLLHKTEIKKRERKSLGSNKNWIATEEYFRDLTLSDIDVLSYLSRSCSISSAVNRKCLSIPVIEEENNGKVGLELNKHDVDMDTDVNFGGNGGVGVDEAIRGDDLKIEPVSSDLKERNEAEFVRRPGSVDLTANCSCNGGVVKNEMIEAQLGTEEPATATIMNSHKVNEQTSSSQDGFDHSSTGNVTECKDVNPNFAELNKLEALPGFYVHPFINQRLLELHGKLSSSDNNVESEDTGKLIPNRGVLDFSPADEVEGQILYFQNKLLNNSVARRHLTDNLIRKAAANLPKEIDASRMQRWDALLIDEYLYELKEAEKQSRKEQRRKEAKARLETPTTRPASSSKKDTVDEASHQEPTYGRKEPDLRMSLLDLFEKYNLKILGEPITQEHSLEELKSIKQVRVGLERLRMLCERIIRREKIKRDLVKCRHEILDSKRDNAVHSMLHPDASSGSTPTSLTVASNIEMQNLNDDAVNRSDNVRQDSNGASENHIPNVGELIPKPRETFENEITMTEEEAASKNQRLPRGYVYVPVASLSTDKRVDRVHERTGDRKRHR